MNNLIFQNYHKHSYYTNPIVSDSTTSYEEYCKRAVELGHGIISSVEHGWQGHYIECHQLAQKYGLKFLFGTEAYWVKDRLFCDEYEHKDGSNCHICLLAMNENGRQAINDILSQAAIDGYYRHSRIDLPLILSLPKDDVICTSACLAFWKYDDIDEIVLQLYEHFGDNFYLEVQYHNTDRQKTCNEHILSLRREHNISIIMGCDSHYIDDKGKIDRDEYIKSKGMNYDDEEGWYMDYPDGETAYNRFAEQCVLSHDEIMEAINNTNVFLNVEEYDCPIFNKDIKMPTLYPDLTQEEKDNLFRNIIWDSWNDYKNEVPEDRWEEYEQQITEEVDIVVKTFHSDYFLLDYEIVKLGKEKGGCLTLTGRGSAPSFFITKLLGFTSIDRISAKVKMYPERFMSPTRILETHSLADIDMNVAKQEPFWEAQEELIGYNHSKQMIAYQQLKPPAAWKMYAKAQDIDFETSNEISNQIKKWQKAVAHADEDDRDNIDVYDYIDKEYHEIFKKSEDYQGVISSMSPHPCASVVYQGDIRKEIGYIYVKPQGGDGVIACCMDGKWAEKYGFLKNDWLKVNVVEVIYSIFDRIGIEPMPATELIARCTPEDKVWDMYKKQCTFGLNQVEQPGSSTRIAKYAPTNISELTAFVAAIRPGFKSMYDVFEARKPFSYDIPTFDKLIQTEEMPNSFVLYQEQAMTTLNYAGIPMSECYAVIKSIAKKRAEEVFKYKEVFIPGFSSKIMADEGINEESANEISEKIWKIIEDGSRYSFNCSHAYSVAIDSLYGAWLKCNYPLEFYEVFLNILNQKGDKDRLNKFKEEAEKYFKITFPPFKFGQDNRKIVLDREHNAINNALSSIKGYSDTMAEAMYECYQCEKDSFIKILQWLDDKSIKSAKIIPLIKIGYFSEYGNENALLKFIEYWDMLKQGNAKSLKKEKVDAVLAEFIWLYANDKNKDGSEAKSWKLMDTITLLEDIYMWCLANVEEPSYATKMTWQQEVLGYIELTTGNAEDTKKVLVTSVTPRTYQDKIFVYNINTRSIGTGKTANLSVYTKSWDMYGALKEMDVIEVGRIEKNQKGYWCMYDYTKLKK